MDQSLFRRTALADILRRFFRRVPLCAAQPCAPIARDEALVPDHLRRDVGLPGVTRREKPEGASLRKFLW